VIDCERKRHCVLYVDDGRRLAGCRCDRRSVPVLHAYLLLSERPAQRQSPTRLAYLHSACRVAVRRPHSAPAFHVHAFRFSNDPHHRSVRAYRAGGAAVGPGARVREGGWGFDVWQATQLDDALLTACTECVHQGDAVAQKRHRNARSVSDYP